MQPLIKRITWVTIFGIAMGFMETVVVVYLRKIYYPNGFNFPLVAMDADLALAEIMREGATIIMLLGIGYLAGKNTSQKFAYFIYTFAIWDIFYYIFLKFLLNWPESLFTWDILFLIPVPWVGPVIAPCIVAASMIILSMSILYNQEKGINTKMSITEWSLFISGSLIVVFSFVWDFFKFIYRGDPKGEIYSVSGKNIEIMNFIPTEFNWWLFISGQLLILIGILHFIFRMHTYSNKNLIN